MTRNTVTQLHRSTELPEPWFAERLQIEEPLLHTTDELIFAAWLGGIAGVLITLAGAFAWSFFL